jgi:hypothetical protein
MQLPRCEEEDPKKKKGRMAGENRRELSWIWLTPKVGSGQSDVVMADEINDCEYPATPDLCMADADADTTRHVLLCSVGNFHYV